MVWRPCVKSGFQVCSRFLGGLGSGSWWGRSNSWIWCDPDTLLWTRCVSGHCPAQRWTWSSSLLQPLQSVLYDRPVFLSPPVGDFPPSSLQLAWASSSSSSSCLGCHSSAIGFHFQAVLCRVFRGLDLFLEPHPCFKLHHLACLCAPSASRCSLFPPTDHRGLHRTTVFTEAEFKAL